MISSAKASRSLTRRRPGRRGGPDETAWQELRSKVEIYKLICDVIRANANATATNLLRVAVQHHITVAGERIEIKSHHIGRLMRDGRIAFEIAYPLCLRLGTDLKMLMNDISAVASLNSRHSTRDSHSNTASQFDVNRLRARCYVSPTILPSSAIMAEAALTSSDHVQATAALNAIRQLEAFSADALEVQYPGIGQLLRQEFGFTLFQRVSPLDGEFAESFLRSTASTWNGASELLGWGEFLPCTFETPSFMRAHHKGLFFDMVGDLLSPDEADELAEGFNRVGDINRERNRTRMRVDPTFSFHALVSRHAVNRILAGEGEFSHITNDELLEEAAYLQELNAQHGDRAYVWLLDERSGERISREAEKEGIDSVFLLAKGTSVLHGLVRFTRGTVESLAEQPRRQRFLAWMINARATCERNGIGEIIELFRTAGSRLRSDMANPL